MDCHEFQKRIGEYPDRDSTPTLREALDRHAAGCSPCAREMSVFRSMRDGFAALEPVHASSGFDGRLAQRLEGERSKSGVVWRPRFSLPEWAPVAGLALAAGLVLVMVGLLMSRHQVGSRGGEMLAKRDLGSGSGATLVNESPRPRPNDKGFETAKVDLPSNASGTQDARSTARWSETELNRLLDQGGEALTPLSGGRRYVIDRPSDLPEFGPGGPEGEVASTPITF